MHPVPLPEVQFPTDYTSSTRDQVLLVSKRKPGNRLIRCKHIMVDTDERALSGDAPLSTMEPSGKNKESEKKKRSRVKLLLANVKKQVEFWFGDVSLQKDRFLRQLIDESQDGYVDISVLTTFNRMKNLTTDCKLIARALINSSVVEVNLEGTQVRRLKPIGEHPKDVDNRTVYVELLPRNVTHHWLKRVFTKCGNVVYISVPRYKTTGHSKGFAFIEFETEEEAQKSVEMLNNPPEDSATKPGIFPKTKNRKLIPNPPSLNVGLDEDEAKKKKKKKKSKSRESSKDEAPPQTEVLVEGADGQETESEPPKKKRRRVTEGSEGGAAAEDTEALPVKKPKKKRRRSQAGESSESDAQGEVPAKLRRTSQDPGGNEPGGKDLPFEVKEEKEDEEEKMDDSLLKAKRKRKKKHKEKTGEEVVPLRVMAKQDWLKLKEEYLTLQKRSFAALKSSLTEIHQQTAEEVMDTGLQQSQTLENRKNVREKEARDGPLFESGCIVKITHTLPLPSRKAVKNALSSVSPVLYLDVVEGDTEGYVRFKTQKEAKAVMDARTELQEKHCWQLEVLSGDHEQRYWQKILVDRQAKLNRPRDKIRGTDKLISKAEKIIKARAKEATKHIRFMDDD
ncbi:hypothetical protein UPYG_G00240910 [Umbra pygmaea]|uniref:La-related protein 7 n=1 Tax=Umbra pygmaea TaxID=75934 RepID=A0ABD0X345_UMBPY